MDVTETAVAPSSGKSQAEFAVQERLAARARLEAVFVDVRTALLDVIKRHRITWGEYRAASDWLQLAGSQNHEIALLLDVFLSPTVDDVGSPANGATESNVEGPFYVSGVSPLEPPYVLPQRTDEAGEILFFSGSVRSTAGAPLARALLDIWQSDTVGEYSYIHPNPPDGNLRGRLLTDESGCFEFKTVIPVPYEIPKQGATGTLLEALGRSAFRPAHVHIKLSHANCRPITTQIYFEDDPWIDGDVVDAVKPELLTRLERHDADSDARSRSLGRPYCSCSYDFVLKVADA
jgi:catechol 1,2-dioxygenase